MFGYKDPLGEFIFHKSILFAQTQSEMLPPLHILVGIAIYFGWRIYFLPSNNRSDDKCTALMLEEEKCLINQTRKIRGPPSHGGWGGGDTHKLKRMRRINFPGTRRHREPERSQRHIFSSVCLYFFSSYT